jgi:myo-inositol-1-phosphate synthase
MLRAIERSTQVTEPVPAVSLATRVIMRSVGTGLWLIGGSGNVATTVAVGLAALRRELTATTGLVSELPALAGVDLVATGELVLGGCEVRPADLVDRALRLAEVDRVLSPRLVDAVRPELEALSGALVPGITGAGPGVIEVVQGELGRFVDRNRLDRLVVVNLASTEPPMKGAPIADPDQLRRAVEQGTPVPPSAIYAAACLDLGHAYVNFTPSTGSSMPALDALAEARGTVHAGRDAKTGQTLVKTTLAPMFAARNLAVLSWFGQNILGNDDGKNLADPEVRRSKQRSKSATLPGLLGHTPEAPVDIRYLPPLGDWKVAWDHILFEGFLGTRMTLELTWHGADSILAAPLVIDLARLCDRALRRGERGLLGYLAAFFKEPMGSAELAHDRQMQLLVRHLTGSQPS